LIPIARDVTAVTQNVIKIIVIVSDLVLSVFLGYAVAKTAKILKKKKFIK